MSAPGPVNQSCSWIVVVSVIAGVFILTVATSRPWPDPATQKLTPLKPEAPPQTSPKDEAKPLEPTSQPAAAQIVRQSDPKPVDPPAPPPPPSHRELLAGEWDVIRTERTGKVLDASEWGHLKWRFEGDRAYISNAGIGGMSGSTIEYRYTTTPNREPLWMDLFAPNERFGFTCVWEVKGDELSICWNAGRNNRPSEFKTSREDFSTLIVMKRKK